MFKLKKQLYLFKIVLFICLGLFLITNKHQVMAMDDDYTNLAWQNITINNNMIHEYETKRNNIFEYILINYRQLQPQDLDFLVISQNNYDEAISDLQEQNNLLYCMINNHRNR